MKFGKIGMLVVLATISTACGSSVSGHKVSGTAQIQVALPSCSNLGVGFADFGSATLQYIGDSGMTAYEISVPVIVGSNNIPFSFYMTQSGSAGAYTPNAQTLGNVQFTASAECASGGSSICSQYAILVNMACTSSGNSSSAQMAVLFQDTNGTETQLGGAYGSSYSSVDEALSDLQ